jgi:hypothetical protein
VRTVVHVTHEAVYKIGGIGAVLEGLLTAKAYHEYASRNILVGPFFGIEGPVQHRLGATGKVLYSSVDGIVGGPYAQAFKKIEQQFGVGVIYGKRRFLPDRSGVETEAEVLLFDVHTANRDMLNRFKARVWERFGIDSLRYEFVWDFEEYMRIAEPAIIALRAMGATNAAQPSVILAHEFMGMPTVLAAMVDAPGEFSTVFYAHEVAQVRKIVEDHPAHDVMFYNALSRATEEGLYIEDVFGSQDHYFKHCLVSASRHCDNILAVGDYVVKELRFLSKDFRYASIDKTYNGIPAFDINLDERTESKARLQKYCESLLDCQPDYIFSHVARMTNSKGFWRDLLVLDHLEKHFRKTGEKAVYFALSSELPRRRPEEVLEMEAKYGWPVAHREGLPDLSLGEANYYAKVQTFNARARNVKVILVNQFGWSRATCGIRMPEQMTFLDIRKGVDVEFGQSIYEPFGIAQLEPLSFGGICVPTLVCGCAGFALEVTSGKPVKNLIIPDYSDLGEAGSRVSLQDCLRMNAATREEVEWRIARKVADQIAENLPKTPAETERMIQAGWEMARQMGWAAVATQYVIPALERAIRKQRVTHVA